MKLQNRLVRTGFGLGPFAFQNEMEEQLRKELDFGRFKEDMTGHFPMHFENSLVQPIVEYLYEGSLEARVTKRLTATARRLTSRKQWTKSQNRTRKLLNVLETGGGFDVEKILRTELEKKGNTSETQRCIQQLSDLLQQILEMSSWWEGIARWAPWGDFYRGYLYRWDMFLRQKQVQTKENRAALIWAAINLMGIARVGDEAIERTLSREISRPKRFVFRESTELDLYHEKKIKLNMAPTRPHSREELFLIKKIATNGLKLKGVRSGSFVRLAFRDVFDIVWNNTDFPTLKLHGRLEWSQKIRGWEFIAKPSARAEMRRSNK